MPLLNLETFLTFVSADGSVEVLTPANHIGRIGAVALEFERRTPTGSIVGLLYRSEPNLVVAWLACLAAGLKPLILQYPTRKQARTYWQDSIENTFTMLDMAFLVGGEHCSGLLGAQFAGRVISQNELETVQAHPRDITIPEAFSIIQLSSGTTGYRKAIEFTHDQLARHVEDYNEVLQLTASDRTAFGCRSITTWATSPALSCR